MAPNPDLADSRPGQIQRARNYSAKTAPRKGFRAFSQRFLMPRRDVSREIVKYLILLNKGSDSGVLVCEA